MNPKFFREPLPYPTVEVRTRHSGGKSLKYIIPPEDREKVLQDLWLYAEPPPKLWVKRCDLHNGKVFRVGDFAVYREGTMNVLASPYYEESGGTVIDWAPASWADKPAK